MRLNFILFYLITRESIIMHSHIMNNTILNDTLGDTTIKIDADVLKQDIIYDDTETNWTQEAIVNIAYYLRSHKFNDTDERYKRDASFFQSFPNPPLRYFHWDVFEHCKFDFLTCLRYLYETAVDAYLQRSIDTVYVIHTQKPENQSKINAVETECNRLKDLDWTSATPFRNRLERFQWRATASYYMCWYTMNKTLELEHFGESCDNTASCLQNGQISNNDIRANDSIPFHCALYSFCPDPCCGNQAIIENKNQCWDDKSNPCHTFKVKTCYLNVTLNKSLISMVYNEWNVTCICNKIGYNWNSRYGICTDYNECSTGNANPCDPKHQECLNFDGKYFCLCKFGYKWSKERSKCVENIVLTNALKRFSGIDTGENSAILKCTTKWINILLAFAFFVSLM